MKNVVLYLSVFCCILSCSEMEINEQLGVNDTMPLCKSDYIDPDVDVSDRTGMKYYAYGSGTEFNNVIPALAQYGLSGTRTSLNSTIAFNELDNSRPLIFNGNGSSAQSSGGGVISGWHAYIVDGYKTQSMTSTLHYRWLIDGQVGEGTLFTDAEVRAMFEDQGIDIEDGMETYEVVNWEDSFYHINWGWNGQQDGYFSTATTGWPFSGSAEMIYGIQ